MVSGAVVFDGAWGGCVGEHVCLCLVAAFLYIKQTDAVKTTRSPSTCGERNVFSRRTTKKSGHGFKTALRECWVLGSQIGWRWRPGHPMHPSILPGLIAFKAMAPVHGGRSQARLVNGSSGPKTPQVLNIHRHTRYMLTQCIRPAKHPSRLTHQTPCGTSQAVAALLSPHKRSWL